MNRVLSLAAALFAIAVAIGVPFAVFIARDFDARYEPFLTLILAPFVQALLLLRFVPALRDPRFAKPVVRRDISRLGAMLIVAGCIAAALVVGRMAPPSLLTWMRAAALLAAAAMFFMSRVRGSLVAAGLLAALAAGTGHFVALADATLVRQPHVIRWIVFFGSATVLVVTLVHVAVERMRPHEAAAFLDLSLAPATVAGLVVMANIYWRPFLTAVPALATQLLAFAAASFAVLAGRAAVRGRHPLDLPRDLRDLFLALIVLVVVSPLWVLPRSVANAIGRAYGRLAGMFWIHGRRVAMINLRRAFPSITIEEARRVTRASFANMGQSIAEGFRRTAPPFRVEEPALRDRVMSDARPKVFVTAHLGSWETTLHIVRERVGGAGIARRVDNRWLDALVRRTRVDDPRQWIEKQGGAGEALDRLRNGESVMMLLDENGGKRGPFVPFFGRPASTRKTAAVLSLLTGAPIVVGAAVREPSGFVFRLEMLEPVSSPGEVVATTQRITAILESWIRDTPAQWRWMHWRWRTRPDGTEERYGAREMREAFGETLDVRSASRDGAA